MVLKLRNKVKGLTMTQENEAACGKLGQAERAALDALLDYIYEYGTAAEGVVERAAVLCQSARDAERERIDMNEWAMVPTEPTEDMYVAAVRMLQNCSGNDDFPRRVWSAMINAAPEPPHLSMTREEAQTFQNWKGMDGACAFLLIERHASGWGDVARMMDAWLHANIIYDIPITDDVIGHLNEDQVERLLDVIEAMTYSQPVLEAALDSPDIEKVEFNPIYSNINVWGQARNLYRFPNGLGASVVHEEDGTYYAIPINFNIKPDKWIFEVFVEGEPLRYQYALLDDKSLPDSSDIDIDGLLHYLRSLGDIDAL